MIMIMIIIKNNKQTGRVQRQKILNVELASLSDPSIKTKFSDIQNHSSLCTFNPN